MMAGFDLSNGIIMTYAGDKLTPIMYVKDIQTIYPEDNDSDKTFATLDLVQDYTISMKVSNYRPWKWAKLYGWRRHTVLRPRKRILIRLLKRRMKNEL